MALIKCEECGHMISDKAIKCPKCGCPTRNSKIGQKGKVLVNETFEPNEHEGHSNRLIYFLIASLLIVLLGVGAYYFMSNGKDTESIVTMAPMADATEANKIEETVEFVQNESEQENTSENIEPDCYLKCPDDNHPHKIDLGLPSGTKWACCNVGAKSPESFGGYYAWGEIADKKNFGGENYTHCDYNPPFTTFHDLGSSICGTEYDIAHVKWGKGWQMPSKDQFDELLDNCKTKRTTVKGVNGWLFLSKNNGGELFLPAAGHIEGADSDVRGDNGDYWTGTQNPDLSGFSYDFHFHEDELFSYHWHRYDGLTVRPITAP